MAEYSVGKPYIPGRRNWPENCEYNYRSGTHELRMFLRGLTGPEVMAIRRGECEFGLFVQEDIILLLYRFDAAVAWSDAPYSWHRVPEGQRDFPEPHGSPEGRDTLQVILVDALTGIVRALRIVSFSPAFTMVLRSAIRDQAARPWPGAAEYDRQLKQIYNRYTSEQIVARAIARTMGGA